MTVCWNEDRLTRFVLFRVPGGERSLPADPVATLYRMVLPDHTCPFGLRAKQLLEEHGFSFDDRLLTSRAEVDDFESEHKVRTTPQIFIDGERIGGCDDLETYLATR